MGVVARDTLLAVPAGRVYTQEQIRSEFIVATGDQ